MPFIAIFDLLAKLSASSGRMGRGIGGQDSSGILLMRLWHVKSHSALFQHASSSKRTKIFLLFSRIRIIFRLTFDQVEISIPSFPEPGIPSSGFIPAESRSADCYHIRTSSLTYVRERAPYPPGHSLPLLGSASFSPLASACALRGAPAAGLVTPAILRS